MILNKLAALWGTFFMLTLVGSCQTQPLARIQGRLHLEPGWHPMVYLIQPHQFGAIVTNFSGTVVDSARIKETGEFIFPSIRNTSETLFQLCVQKTGNRFPNQLHDENPLLANYMPLVLQVGESIEIRANIGSLQSSFQVLGPSKVNQSLLQLRDIRHRAFKQLPQSKDVSATSDEEHILEHEAAIKHFQQPLIGFADTCRYFFPAVVATRWVSPLSDYERVPEFLQRICDKWGQKPPENTWLSSICSPEATAKRPLLIGGTVPNAALPMLAGDTVLLHTLLGSKLTVLDIWASWCAPCRKENKAVLLPLWNKNQSKGLQIIGYSIDSNMDSWKTHIVKGGLLWPHASHLNGDDAPLMQTLHITTIPANFILDSNGKVLAKNLHGDALRDFVETYLGQ